MKVLELGNYIIPAYAGMVLAEQGAQVTKWTGGNDPICGLLQGAELWAWINTGKHVIERSAQDLLTLSPDESPDIVLENFRPQTLERWGIDPVREAERLSCVWVSMRSECGEISFDLIAQCRSWLEYSTYVPFYIGDTAGGLWLAFKALSMFAQGKPGHYQLGQATCMQKLIEGELSVTPTCREPNKTPWDQEGTYYFDEQAREAVILYKGKMYREPVRDQAWKKEHLWHHQGRMHI